MMLSAWQPLMMLWTELDMKILAWRLLIYAYVTMTEFSYSKN